MAFMITEEYFDEKYWGEVASINWTAVVWHDWEKIPHAITSDIDYVIFGPRPSELIGLISDYCETNGWSLWVARFDAALGRCFYSIRSLEGTNQETQLSC